MDIPDLPSRLATELLRALIDDQPDRETALLAEAARSGTAIVADLAETFDAAYGLDDDAAFDIRLIVEDLLIAANVPEGFEALLRDLARREPAEASEAIERLIEIGGDGGWAVHALPLRNVALADGDDALRAVCSQIVCHAEPGETGVFDALLDEHRRDPPLGLGLLCRHDDEQAASILLAWLREQRDVADLESETRALACDVSVALVDWSVPLAPAEHAWATSAISKACDDLAWENRLLRDEIAGNDDVIAALRSRLPGRLRPAEEGKKPGRNEPCACGSGKKTKRCCG